MRRLLAIVTVASIALTACAPDSGAGAREPVVFAAASLTEVFSQIEPVARFNFAGSDQLATQIREGARADVYAAASPTYPTALFREGRVERPVVFATNRLVVVVPASNPARISAVEDLRRPGVKLVVGAEGVPIGDYTRRVLADMNVSDVLSRVVSEEQDVKGVIGKVALGEADAGFVYATDIGPVRDKVRAFDLPARERPGVSYMVAILRDAPHAASGRAFVAKLLGANGRRALAAAGFGLP